ncbi:carboxymuconolactone decarboxylase family protein [Streptomyces sp. NPDC048718]|uniref:carboxymuconolactone decarboxylase family protein n=1 Tax=Streptomyces sp. NPDC048718 TaxID=3365587 RepID=UPI00371A9821
MEPRINPFGNPLALKMFKHLTGAGMALVTDSTLPESLQELVKIRASQINGCGACLDMHTKEATAAGETSVRLALVGAWREATVYTDAERAALALTEYGTRLADGYGIPDDVWEAAAKHFDEDQLIALTGLIALINAFNRINVVLRLPAGEYKVGQYATKG